MCRGVRCVQLHGSRLYTFQSPCAHKYTHIHACIIHMHTYIHQRCIQKENEKSSGSKSSPGGKMCPSPLPPLNAAMYTHTYTPYFPEYKSIVITPTLTPKVQGHLIFERPFYMDWLRDHLTSEPVNVQPRWQHSIETICYERKRKSLSMQNKQEA